MRNLSLRDGGHVVEALLEGYSSVMCFRRICAPVQTAVALSGSVTGAAMNTHVSLPLVAALVTLISTPTLSLAQVPADLRAAARARSDALSHADAATWDRLTADSFTVT